MIVARQVALKAAAAFAASRPDAKSPNVLTVADLWLRWVEGEAAYKEGRGGSSLRLPGRQVPRGVKDTISVEPADAPR
jgi:hypothetical protein